MQKLITGLFLLTTLSAPVWADNEKPSTVEGVSATAITDNSVRVTWNKPWDNVGVAGYNIYRNGIYYTTVFDTNYIDSNVSTNNEYRYGIVAFDDAKNYNRVSSEATVTVGNSNGNGTVAPPPPESNNGSFSDVVNSPDSLNAEIRDSNTAVIKWSTPSGNPLGYNVYLDGNYETTVSSPEYTANNLAYGEDHKFSIVAFSQSKRFSRQSDELTVNTANGSTLATNNNSNNNQPQNDDSSGGGSAPDGYRLVFSDEFNQYSLDSSKWNSGYRWGHEVINNEEQYYVDRINNPDFGHSPFEFDGNHMTINATRTPDHLRSSANGKSYLSGALTTYNKFTMKYGYVEMRAKFPKGKGIWPALWLLHQNESDRTPEIDIVEFIGDDPYNVYHTFHWVENWSNRRSPYMVASGPDYSQDFHTYAVKWEPGKITWYIDGQERNSFSNGNVSWENMYILVNLAVGGSWPGSPDGNTQFPARYQIDYIRAYQK